MDVYRELILDHYKHPRNFGTLENPDASANGANATCGDHISMQVMVQNVKQKRLLTAIKFSGVGCAISQATASLLTEKVTGMECHKILSLGLSDIVDLLGTDLTPSRVKCALLPLEVLQKTLVNGLV